MFDYVERYNEARQEPMGWVCMVNKADVLKWLEAHRPLLYERVTISDDANAAEPPPPANCP
jgi:hypothetical protein